VGRASFLLWIEKSVEKEAKKIQKWKSDSGVRKSYPKSDSKRQKNEKYQKSAREELVKLLIV